MTVKSKSAGKSAGKSKSASKSKPASKSTAKRTTPRGSDHKSARAQLVKSGKRGAGRIPGLAAIAHAAELLCDYNGPKSKRVRTLQAIPSTPRVQMVLDTIGRRKPADVLGGKTADESTGLRLGFASLTAATEYAAGRTANIDVPIETRRAMAALAGAVASGADRTPQQTKVNGRVLVAILVAAATSK